MEKAVQNEDLFFFALDPDPDRRIVCELIAGMPAIAAVHEGPDHVYIQCSSDHEAAVGHRRVLGLPLRKAMPELEGQDIVERFDQVYRTGRASHVGRLLIRRTFGSDAVEECWYVQILQPWQGANGRVRGVISIALDISSQVRAEQLARDSHKRFATIFNQAAVGIALLAPDGRWLEANARVCQMLGYPREVLLQKTFIDITHPDDLDKNLELARRLIAGEIDSYSMEKRYIRSDGSTLWADLLISMVSRGPEGEVIAVIRDSNDRKLYQRQLDEANRDRDEFVAVLGHELCTPLASIRYAASLLDLGPMSPRSARAVEVIDRQAELMSRLIGDVRDLARIRRGKLHLDRQVVDLRDVLMDVACDQNHYLSARSLAFVVQIPDEPLRALVDPARIMQAIGNLLHNAIRHTESGGKVALSVRRQGNEAVIEVKDTGQGIPADALPHVFDAFHQIDAPGRPSGNLGLGLALVKHLAERHGGAVCAHSPGPQQGAEFALSLPLL